MEPFAIGLDERTADEAFTAFAKEHSTSRPKAAAEVLAEASAQFRTYDRKYVRSAGDWRLEARALPPIVAATRARPDVTQGAIERAYLCAA